MNRSPMLVTTAGVLVLVAVAGSLTFDWFWWSLMPAAGLLAAGLFGAFQTLSPPMPRFAGLGLGAAALVALLGSIAGWVAVNRIGVEPDWVGSLATGTATAVIVAAATLGIGLVAEGRGSRLTGFLLATALPIGLGIDWGLDMLLPPGHPDIFLLGAGFYLGMALFGIALIRLGRFLTAFTGGFAQGRRRFRRAVIKSLGLALLAAFVVACASTTSPSSTSAPQPDQPIDGVGAVIDWEDPNKVVEVGGGWTVQACDGDAPLLCVERNGLPVGGVEAIAYPISSFDTLDPTADAETNLRRFAEGFVEAIGTDRAAGCGPDYLFQAIPAEPFVLGGAPGIAYGFAGTMPDGRPSELNLQYATTVADHILSIVAIAYDEGGCPGRDDLSGFDSATLTRFRPHLEDILHQSPLPDLGL